MRDVRRYLIGKQLHEGDTTLARQVCVQVYMHAMYVDVAETIPGYLCLELSHLAGYINHPACMQVRY
jgi:hypothetical protein